MSTLKQIQGRERDRLESLSRAMRTRVRDHNDLVRVLQAYTDFGGSNPIVHLRRALDCYLDISEEQATPPVARPIGDWREDIGDALWWKLPIDEPPWCGTPLDSDWPGYHTHWTPLIEPRQASDGAAI